MSIPIIDTLNPLGNFPVAKSEHIDCNGTNLNIVLNASATELSKKVNATYANETYAKKSEIPTVPSNVSAFTNDAGYLTQHQDISGKADNSTVTNIGKRVTDVEEEQDVLSVRIDAIVALPEGSTTGDAELIDIRTGANSKTYESAGDAVRGQINDVKNDIYWSGTLENPSYTTGFFIWTIAPFKKENSDYKYSDPIYVEENSIIRVKARGYQQNVSIISKSSASGEIEKSILASTDSTYRDYSYNVIESGYYVICGNINDPILINIERDYKKEINQIVKDIQGINGQYTRVDFSNATKGSFINPQGQTTTASDFSISEPISLSKGQKIVLIGQGYTTNVSMISEYVNSEYVPKVTSINSSVTRYEYLCTENCQVVLCYNHRVDYSGIIYVSNAENLMNSVAKSVDFNGSVTNKFVAANGNISVNNSFRITKPFAVKRGQTVVVKACGYQRNVAIVSEYINETTYKPIVLSEATEVRTYEYTSLKDTTIAISYDYTKDFDAIIKVVPDETAIQTNTDFTKMFHKIGGIGDSLMSGSIYYNDGGTIKWGNFYNYSWLSNICRSSGTEFVHYSVGGLTAKTWLDGNYLTTIAAEENKCSAYYIALGTNDIGRTPYSLGESTDAAGTNTFCGWYKQIIERLRSVNPNCIIFAVSLYTDGNTYREYSNKIEEISKLYSKCYYIDFINNTDIYTESGTFAFGSHFNTMGYIKVAETIKALTNTKIRENIIDFSFLGVSYPNI